MTAMVISDMEFLTPSFAFEQAIKLYAWEEPYKKRVTNIRDEELKEVEKAAVAQGLSVMTFTIGPIFITIAAFVVYGAMGKTLSASVAFPAIALFNLLRFPILLLPMQILNIINCKVRAASLLCMLLMSVYLIALGAVLTMIVFFAAGVHEAPPRLPEARGDQGR